MGGVFFAIIVFMKVLERFFVLSLFLILPLFIHAQTLLPERRAQLESELSELQKQIDEQKAILEVKQRQSVSLERDVNILSASIEKAKLNIKARDISIAKLNSDIAEKQSTIGVLNDKLDKEKESLASIIRKTYELESYSLPEVMFSSQNFSDFFEDAGAFIYIQSALKDSFVLITENKDKTEKEKSDLEEKKQEQLDLKAIQEFEKKKIEQQEAEKKRILKESKGIEAEYQKIIKSKETNAAKIRAELFILRGSSAIPFEKAYELAVRAETKTGVRPAFLLGIIAEESKLGENVGTGNWKVDMHPTRDVPVFKKITEKLGLDPDKMPVSKKAWYGWGGAMGPAQFIPSTWVLYEDKISKLTGHNPPNPWDPEDAFMGSAIYLKDSGAAKKTVAAERYAALCYLAGCKNATKKAYQFYADDVMELADKYQKQINIIKQ
jgi:membrane-bound lytic murein transglycosylase B